MCLSSLTFAVFPQEVDAAVANNLTVADVGTTTSVCAWLIGAQDLACNYHAEAFLEDSPYDNQGEMSSNCTLHAALRNWSVQTTRKLGRFKYAIKRNWKNNGI